MDPTRRARMAKTKAAAKASPSPPIEGLLDLPPELRNMIYDYVLANGVHIIIDNQGLGHASLLGLTCRQLYTEFHPMYQAQLPTIPRIFECRVLNFDFAPIDKAYDIIDAALWAIPEPRPAMKLIVNLVFDGTPIRKRDGKKLLAPMRALECLDMYAKRYRVTGELPGFYGVDRFNQSVSPYLADCSHGVVAEWKEIARKVYKEYEDRGLIDSLRASLVR